MQLQAMFCLCPTSQVDDFIKEIFEEKVVVWVDQIPLTNLVQGHFPDHTLLIMTSYDVMIETIYMTAKKMKSRGEIKVFEANDYVFSQNYEDRMIKLAELVE